ncbi:F0F1 ATP synthase subunit gamma [Candidatus Parcubacteria bacterium]|nr:F0F1 ATP synthase subunit gamma [Candidatus Parcubacteria bacterium]
MPSTKDIQRRIKSVTNTKKITRAMEMVAASKMRKAVEAVLRTRPYANLSWSTVLNLSRAAGNGNEGLHPLLTKRKIIKKVGIILISSNRGLCGGFNTAIINKAHESIKKHHQISPSPLSPLSLRRRGAGGEVEGRGEVKSDFIIIGKKGAAVNKYYGYNLAAEFGKADIISEVKEVLPISGMVISDYLSGKYDKIMVAYTDFISAAKQEPRVKQLLPVDIEAEEEYLGIVGQDTRLKTDKELIDQKQAKRLSKDEYTYEYTFEPSPSAVLDEMVPRLIEVQLFQALLESNASEHSARMSAMNQATGAADDMVKELTLFYNKARQAAITAEIAEISAGANALAE